MKEKLFNYNCKKKSLKKSLKNDIYVVYWIYRLFIAISYFFF